VVANPSVDPRANYLPLAQQAHLSQTRSLVLGQILLVWLLYIFSPYSRLFYDLVLLHVELRFQPNTKSSQPPGNVLGFIKCDGFERSGVEELVHPLSISRLV
jgi:hypothetical protein